MVSIIIPTHNEASTLPRMLACLRRVRGEFEVIVVDGESSDGTPDLLEGFLPDSGPAIRVLRSGRNRGEQLNRGADLARGEALLFLHADALPPPTAVEAVEAALQDPAVVGGNFRLIFEGNSLWSRFFTWANRIRRSFGIYYGDSGVFVRREVFFSLGGFQPIPVMEDYEFVRRMEKRGRTVCLGPPLRVSDRRWRVQGVLRTLGSWGALQVLYGLGVSPRSLARWYRPVREQGRDRLPRSSGSHGPEKAKSPHGDPPHQQSGDRAHQDDSSP